MTRYAPAAFLVLAALFLTANRGAYEGFFSGDDLDNISWARDLSPGVWARELVSPRYSPQNFRPTGHGVFHALARAADLRFPPYVAVIQAVHLAAALLLYLLFRSAPAALFFVFHMALFDAFWKPMFLFDLLCGLFCLLSLLAWKRGWWVAAFAAFWLAYKSKEVAVMLPAVLLWYEYTLGARRWKPLLPFLAASLSFGAQALWNRHSGDAYTLRFTPASFSTTVSFYAQHLMVKPWLALLLVPLAWRRHDRRVWFGAGALLLFLVPMLLLPGRLFAVYLYVPMIGLAAAVSALPAGRWLTGAVVLWLAFNFTEMRRLRNAALADAQEAHAYFDQLRAVTPALREAGFFVYDNWPRQLDWWGVNASIRLLTGRPQVEWVSAAEVDLASKTLDRGVMLLSWVPAERRLISTRQAEDIAFLEMDRGTPVWQLESGWYRLEGRYRWTRPSAVARLRKPPDASRFELRVLVGPAYIAAVKRSRVSVLLDGSPLGSAEFTTHGWQTVSWPVAAAPARTVRVEFRAEPSFYPGPSDPRPLGIAVGAFGFR